MGIHIDAVCQVLDDAFDFCRPNVLFSAVPLTGLLTSTSLQLAHPGSGILPDAFVVQLSMDGGTVVTQPTVVIEGTLDGIHWAQMFAPIAAGFATSGTLLVAIATHTGTGQPTHVCGVRARISVVGSGTGLMTVLITA